MNKGDILNIYTFLGNSVKMTALTDAGVRSDVIGFIRSIRKLAIPILDELNVSKEPAFAGDEKAVREAKESVLNEEYTGELPKIKTDSLMDAVIGSKIDIPVIAVLNSFEPFLED